MSSTQDRVRRCAMRSIEVGYLGQRCPVLRHGPPRSVRDAWIHLAARSAVLRGGAYWQAEEAKSAEEPVSDVVYAAYGRAQARKAAPDPPRALQIRRR
eukprot:1343015-Rhodomonas_salina.1